MYDDVEDSVVKKEDTNEEDPLEDVKTEIEDTLIKVKEELNDEDDSGPDVADNLFIKIESSD